MTKEKIQELWDEAWNGLGKQNIDIDIDSVFAIRDEFVSKLLLDCAKIVCFMCREGNVPEKGVHVYSKMSHEPCRATQFYIEEEK